MTDERNEIGVILEELEIEEMEDVVAPGFTVAN